MHHPRQPAAHKLDKHFSFPPPIQMRHKGRNACSACKKAHIKCVYDEGQQSCHRCSTRALRCSRSGTHQPADAEASASPASRPSENASMHQTQLGAGTDVQPVSQDVQAGQPRGITEYGDVQRRFHQDARVVADDQLGWYLPFDHLNDLTPQTSPVANPQDMLLYETVPQYDPSHPSGYYVTPIPWGVNPPDDGQYQVGYAEQWASQTDPSSLPEA